MGKEDGIIVTLLDVLQIYQYSFSSTVSNGKPNFEEKNGLWGENYM
jgi:hypothetical protein